MKLTMNKNTALSILLAVVTVVILWRITPVYVDPVIKLTIIKTVRKSPASISRAMWNLPKR